MSDTFALRVAKRGLITLPQDIRKAYGIEPGDEMTLLDLGGLFVLSTRRSEVDDLADRLGERLIAEHETLETMLGAIREERARYEA
jgi:bifunctional DNA-binding transcriptional regulator/antitoxin component of YhaV-PrlF toxin-antitoxin module